MLESKDYDEWDYTRRDGKTVLLVLNEDTAEIFADLPDAFITIDLDSKILVDGKEVPMTRAALEQLAELFDLSIQPHPTTMEQVEKYKADAKAPTKRKERLNVPNKRPYVPWAIRNT